MPAAQAPYRLTLLGDPPAAQRLARLVSQAAQRRLGGALLETTNSLRTDTSDPALAAAHHVVIWIHAPGHAAADRRGSLAAAVNADLPILPILVDGARPETLPGPLPAINALRWEADSEVTEAVLRLLGLSEPDRRVFISYRRADTTALADQLRRALIDRGFDVFVDRFDVPPAADHQWRIDVELGDKAFVLVLESDTIRDSPWIRHEIVYALQHRITVQALTVPNLPASKRMSELDGFRTELALADLVPARRRRDRVLTASALTRTCRALEVLHADRLHRHREQLMGTLADWLRQAGNTVTLGPDWTVVADDGAAETLYLVTPRAPTAGDLHRAHLAREARRSGLPAIVAHNPRDLDAAAVALNAWVADGRNISTAIHEDLRHQLGAR